MIFSAGAEGDGLKLPGYAYGIPLMLILPAYALAKNKAPVLRIAGIFPFLYLAVFVLMVASKLGGMPPMETVGIGIWITLLGGVGAFVGSYFLEPKEGGMPVEAPAPVDEPVDHGDGDSK